MPSIGDSRAHYPSLRNKTVVITGGANGIGSAFVRRFHDQGSHVCFLDNDERAGIQTLIELTSDSDDNSPEVQFLPCDVTDIHSLQTTITSIGDMFGGIDVLINNAANDDRHNLEELSSQLWDDCIAVNLKHQLFASLAASPFLVQRGGGSIICLGSIAWLNNTTGMIGYTIAKSAIHGLVRTLARQLGPQCIRVNALLPGWTMTKRQREKWVNNEAKTEIARAQCLPGRVTPDDVASMALFLGAADSKMCSQQSFIVDGGWI